MKPVSLLMSAAIAVGMLTAIGGSRSVHAESVPSQYQAFIDDLLANVTSKLYLSRIQHQPEAFIQVGVESCAEMRTKGYKALLAQQTGVSGHNVLRNQPQGNDSYRGRLLVQMSRTVLESARKHICPDAPLEK